MVEGTSIVDHVFHPNGGGRLAVGIFMNAMNKIFYPYSTPIVFILAPCMYGTIFICEPSGVATTVYDQKV
jgi:hypothetical protein